MKLRVILTAMVIALTTPAFADISDYDSMHRRLADVIGSRAQADAAYDRPMKEANTCGPRVCGLTARFWRSRPGCMSARARRWGDPNDAAGTNARGGEAASRAGNHPTRGLPCRSSPLRRLLPSEARHWQSLPTQCHPYSRLPLCMRFA
jgi:hypothetical protein